MEFVDSLQTEPIANVATGIANPQARKRGLRFIDVNLVMAFPGDSISSKYEERQAVEVLRASQGFDTVIDLHNINGLGANTGIIDRARGISKRGLGFLASLHISKLVLSDFGGLQKYAPNCFVLETVASGFDSIQPEVREALEVLANNPHPPLAPATEFEWFDHLGSPHVSQATPDCIPPELYSSLQPFDQLPQEISSRLGLGDLPVHLMSWCDVANTQGYWGEAVTPAAVPNTENWPS